MLHLLAPIVLALCPDHVGAAENVDPAEARHRSLVIVIDGLRPDYVTAELMPNLHGLAERGVFGEAHHAAYPTVTRVNSSSISTGSHPGRHGIMHNTLFLPEVSDRPIGTGRVSSLRRIGEASDGRILTATTMAEVLEQNGQRILTTGSGGVGAALLMNPHVSGAGIWTARGEILAEEAGEEAEQALGGFPERRDDLVEDRDGLTRWAVDAYLHHALGDNPPDVTTFWITDPDGVGHRHGVGAPETLRALANVDRQVGRILDAHEEHGLADRVNIFVTSDHGFSTFTGEVTLPEFLSEHELDEGVTVVGRSMIFMQHDDSRQMTEIVTRLQQTDWAGPIFTRHQRPGSIEGIVPGTFSFDVIHWNHERSADILVEPRWTDDVNEHGYRGTTTFRGTAGHGSASPFDLHIPLIAAGPDIKSGLRSVVPTGNIDIAPTIYHLHGIRDTPELDGRILHELLRGGPAPEDVEVFEQTHHVEIALPDGTEYQAELHTARVGSTVYLRSATVLTPGQDADQQ